MAYDEITRTVTVTECNTMIKSLLDEAFYQIAVRGEISGANFRPSAGGHYYFDLKDAQSSISSCVFRSQSRGMENFRIGDSVVAYGRISLYEKTGKLTFVINRMVKEGDGLLNALIEKRKLYYRNLGWFDADTKPEIPQSISSIGVITSATGAVIHDILTVTGRRAPSVNIILLPCLVQGKGAEETISSRIRQANNFDICDVLIVARGGGSREDLMPYNEDAVIEAVHNSHIPVISAVGHESDWTLTDYVATLRAGTPSIAAEKVTENIFRSRSSFSSVRETMSLVMKAKISRLKEKVPSHSVIESLMKMKLSRNRSIVPSSLEMKNILVRRKNDCIFRFSMKEEEMRRIITDRVEDSHKRVQMLSSSLCISLPHTVENGRRMIREMRMKQTMFLDSGVSIAVGKLKSTEKEMNALNPQKVLERGYALVTDKNGHVITDAGKVKKGDELAIRVRKGKIDATVKEICDEL